MRIPIITTCRLILRPFSEMDGDALYAILSEEGILRYFPPSGLLTREQVDKMIFRLLQHWEEHGYGLWAVAEKENSRLLGRCGLQVIPETKEVEIDFILGKPFWGQGFATEAANASLRFGFDKVGIETIVGIVHPENKASQRVLEKLGMKLVDHARYFGMEVYRYAIDRASWERQPVKSA